VGDKLIVHNEDYFEVRLGRGEFTRKEAARFKIIGVIEKVGNGEEYLILRLVLDRKWFLILALLIFLGIVGVIILKLDWIIIPVGFLLVIAQLTFYTKFSLRKAKNAIAQIEALNSK
jgi:hypothetical protein